MAVNVVSEEGRCRIAVNEELTISRASALAPQLFGPLSDSHEVEIDLAGVIEIDSAGLQLLLVAKKEAVTKGVTLRLVAHSKAVVELLDLCNLTGHFGDPVVIPSQSRPAEVAK